MDKDQLATIACQLVQKGKGILAADESPATIGKRFAALGIESTPEKRRDWRELLLRTEGALEACISGMIFHDETLQQNARDGLSLVSLAKNNNALPGIKVDIGTKTLALSDKEFITEGLDGLQDRLITYRKLGAAFAKWRAVIVIDNSHLPTSHALKANISALTYYAALCQEIGLVPIIEPEILMDGTHDIFRCLEVTAEVLKTLYEHLYEAKIFLEGTILKPNMVLPGNKCTYKASPEEIAERTIKVLRNCVPAAVPGIAFLSGGQTPESATEHLAAMQNIRGCPWTLTFSYGRALQDPAQKIWAGKDENIQAAQEAFRHRARMNSLAASGQWDKRKEIS